MTEPKFKRSKILVDPEFQIGLSLEMVGWTYVYFLAFALVANLSSLIALVSAAPTDSTYLAALDQLRGFARYVVLPMGITFVAIAVHGVYLTHRIAGPIIRLKRTMREIAARRLPAPITLRPKDHFQDLADEMNAAVAVLREDDVRRKRMADEAVATARQLVHALENRPSDLRESLTLACASLDAIESLRCHLTMTNFASADGARAIPLPETDLPAVVEQDMDESLDELDSEFQAKPQGAATER
ncbi:MAG: methyl-accepting chemotaxis protein [Planctomycetes bacterium]|nr:methyl-accepting chemotaxis protein [Planctomycetota bacterium]